MTKVRDFIDDMCDIVRELIDEGQEDVSASEIADRKFGAVWAPQLEDLVAKNILKVRERLELDGLSLYPVSIAYYTRYSRSCPETETEARACLPIGRGKRAVGLRRTPDLIWKMYLGMGLASANGKVGKVLDRATNVLGAKQAAALIVEQMPRLRSASGGEVPQLEEGVS